jgi:hypothetical protein
LETCVNTTSGLRLRGVDEVLDFEEFPFANADQREVHLLLGDPTLTWDELAVTSAEGKAALVREHP